MDAIQSKLIKQDGGKFKPSQPIPFTDFNHVLTIPDQIMRSKSADKTENGGWDIFGTKENPHFAREIKYLLETIFDPFSVNFRAF